MKEKIKILESMVAEDAIEELKVKCDYPKAETTISFCFYYVEFLPDEPFFCKVFPDAKRFFVDGLDDESGRGMMTLVFDGVLNENVN